MRFLASFVFTCFLTLSQLVSAQTSAAVLKDFTATIQEVSQIYKSNYASADFKAQKFQWNNDLIVQDLISRAQNHPNLTLLDAQNLVQEFFNSTRDYHAQAFFLNKPYVSLPLGMYSAQGRVYITFVASTYTGPIKVGDQVILYGNDNVGDAIFKLMTPKYPNMMNTDLRDATRRLTARYGLLMDPIPTDPNITLTLLDQNGNKYTETLAWNGFPTAVPPATPWSQSLSLRNDEVRIPENLRGTMLDDAFGYSSRKSYFPRPDKITWEAADTDRFYAWIGEMTSTKSATPKRVGLIRIPTFSVGKPADYAAAVLAFKDLVHKMNQETDLLVLDIQGNRGGMMDYAEALISFFIDQPKEAYKFQYKLFPGLLQNAQKSLAELSALTTQDDIVKYFGGDHYYGYPLDMDFVNDVKAMYAGLLEDAKTSNLAQPRYYNAAKVKPYPGFTPYLKPLYVATDGWSVSCGDFFPAFMQDHKLAKIIGTQTAGAGAFTGGQVAVTANSLQLRSIVAPIALGYRLNGVPLENVGVTPDHFIAPVPRDLKDGKFDRYKEKMYQLLDKLTP